MIATKKEYQNNINSESKLTCKDHLVSGKKFDIWQYENGILKTEPFPEDLSKYYESENYISHTDSKRSFQDRIYHLVKSYMLSKKAKWIRRYFKHGTILDFGAGTGEFLNKMKSFYWNVDGVEPNKLARDLGILKGINLKSDLSKVEKKDFDVISLWHVLEHLPDLENKIKEFDRRLVDNGILVIAVPNHNSYDAKYYKENWAAWDVPRHLWHFSRDGIKNKLLNFGFELLDEKPLKFDSYYVSLLSEKNAGGKLIFINALYRGCISNYKAKSSGEYSSIVYFFRKTT